MIYVKIILFCIVFILLNFFVGNYICYLLNFKRTVSKIMCVGFVFLLVSFHLIIYPFSAAHGSFYIASIFYLIVIIIAFAVSVYYYLAKGKVNFGIKNIDAFTIIIILLIVGQACLSSYMYHDDDDDGYFITTSATTIESGIFSSEIEYVSTGIETTEVDIRTNTATWEYFVAFYSFIFSIDVVIMAHTVLPLLLIPLSYFGIYQISVCLVEDEIRKYFMLFFILLNYFGGYIVYSTACFLLLRIWQGKAVLVSIIFPILLGNCIEVMRDDKIKRQYWVFNALILLAGVSLTVIGVYLTPIYYLLMGIPYLISLGWKKSREIIILAIASLMPCAIFTGIAFVELLQNNHEYLSATSPDWFTVFKNNILSGYYYILYVGALIYVGFKGTKIQKLILCGISILAFLTFLNPLFCNLVAQKITGVDVYWRLYWTLPIYYTISFMLAALCIKLIKNSYKILMILCTIIVLNNIGSFMYKAPIYSNHTNIYKLPNEVIDTVDYILINSTDGDKPNVLYPESLSAKVRQYSINVKTVWSRALYQGDNIIPNTDILLSTFYYSLYDGSIMDEKYLIDTLDTLGIEWIVVPEDYSGILAESSGIKLSAVIDGYSIYKHN